MPDAGTRLKAYNVIKQDTVSTSQGTTSSSYTDLATVGPSVTVHLEVGQSCLFIIEAQFSISAAGVNGAAFSLDVAGPSTSDLAAADANGCETGVTAEWVPGTKHTLFTATAAGDHVGSIKYKRIASDTANFKERRITAIPQPPP